MEKNRKIIQITYQKIVLLKFNTCTPLPFQPKNGKKSDFVTLEEVFEPMNIQNDEYFHEFFGKVSRGARSYYTHHCQKCKVRVLTLYIEQCLLIVLNIKKSIIVNSLKSDLQNISLNGQND